MGAQRDGAIPEKFQKAFTQRFWDDFYKLDGWLAQKQAQLRHACWTIRREWFLSCQEVLRPCLENCWRMSRGLSRRVMAPASEEAERERLESGMDKCVSKCLSDELAEIISQKIKHGESDETSRLWHDLQNDPELTDILGKHGVRTTDVETCYSILSTNRLEGLFRGIFQGITKSQNSSLGNKEQGTQPPSSKPAILIPRYSDHYPVEKGMQPPRTLKTTEGWKEFSPNAPSMSVVALWPPRRLGENQVSQGCQSSLPKYGLHFVRSGTCFASSTALNQARSTNKSTRFSQKVDKTTQVNFPLTGHIFKSKVHPTTDRKLEYIPHALANSPRTEERWETSMKIPDSPVVQVKVSKSMPYQAEKNKSLGHKAFTRDNMTCTWTHRRHTPIWHPSFRSSHYHSS